MVIGTQKITRAGWDNKSPVNTLRCDILVGIYSISLEAALPTHCFRIFLCFTCSISLWFLFYFSMTFGKKISEEIYSYGEKNYFTWHLHAKRLYKQCIKKFRVISIHKEFKNLIPVCRICNDSLIWILNIGYAMSSWNMSSWLSFENNTNKILLFFYFDYTIHLTLILYTHINHKAEDLKHWKK